MKHVLRPAALGIAAILSILTLFTAVQAEARGRARRARRPAVASAPVFAEAHVSRAIQARISTIRQCYERRRRNIPDLAGKVTVEFTVELSGGVANARATENTTRDDGVASCIVGTVSRLRFDPAPVREAVTLNYPFVFAP